jgi:hypothetical protein
MLRPRDIIRGTFRLSLVVAVGAVAYSAYSTFDVYKEALRKNAETTVSLQLPLECAARLLKEQLKAAENDFGLVDLTKLGCAQEPFLAKYEELNAAREGKLRQQIAEWQWQPPRVRPEELVLVALSSLVVVNLLGFALVGVWSVFRWVTRGFRPATKVYVVEPYPRSSSANFHRFE